MHVSHLALTDFRSYAELDLPLEPGVSAFVGPNGQGKTNLVEAIGYVSTLSSHRVAADSTLVRAGAPRAVVRLRARRADRETLIELEISPGRANRAQINRSPVRRTRDVLGIVRTVVFAPEDLALVKGDPDGRRRFLDALLVQVSPRMAGVLADYERVLRQRGALLKSAGGLRRHARVPAGAEPGGAGDLGTLDVWDAKLAQLGAEILAARLRLAEQLRPHVATAYEQVSDGGRATLGYRSSVERTDRADDDAWPGPAEPGAAAAGDVLPHAGASAAELEAQILAALARVRRQELDRGVNLVGPHRDDLLLGINDLPAKGYASHGESWSLALALRLACYHLLTHGDDDAIGGWVEGSAPILVLDDVFAELDDDRRDRLVHLVADAEQVLITAAVPHDVPAGLSGQRYAVLGGTVRRA
ncbi:DNA replication/repair protein RecF [Actinotalea fermentans]|uniref:DNA replication and repair protein RecF n=1 Tax=Actinotalea fermentans TaxID=43671 RepID=A0A511Z242_9CELL|nr:DNA replication/repair protein RecF [Actinotalea fermentans]KGM16840.1 recombinase RecF [Actinotalea fermentans ATCC 43279 = JCM 9966 = DSM 3133]GEN81518.1 DNA replication and repair protein RecF [Actinotalea fermentans]